MRISYSRCATYQYCPQQYKLQYVDRIPPPRMTELEFGNAVHAALKCMYNPTHVIMPSLEQVLDVFARDWGESPSEEEKETRQAYFEQGIDLLRRQYDKYTKREGGGRTLDTERFFNLPFDGEHSITGRIDRIDLLPDGRVEVIDYKTSRRMPPRSLIEKNSQLAIYRMAASADFPDREVCTTLLYVVHDLEVQTTQTPEFLAEKQEEIREVIAGIEECHFEPNPGPQCDWCGYQAHCELYRAPVVPPDLAKVDIGTLLREYTELNARGKQTEARLGEVRKRINDYLDRCKTEYMKSGGYSVMRRHFQKLSGWDEEQVRAVLEPKGLWKQYTQVNSSALRELLKFGPLKADERRRLREAAHYSEYSILRVKSQGQDDEETE